MGRKQKLGHTEKVVMTTCRSHCGGTCILKVHVRDGVISRIESDDRLEPEYRPCAKGRAYRQRVYDPDRLKYPMKRIGERGAGSFVKISWDEALNAVASEIKRVNKAYGPSAVLFMCSWGDIGWLQNPGLIDRLLVKTGGYSGVWGSASNEGQLFAAWATYGTAQTASTRDDLINSRLIIMWGWNPTDSRGYGDPRPYLARAKEAGARIVSVDPRYTNTTAVFADQWIPIRPTTDTAMLIAMAYVIIAENLQDKNFLDKYTIGFNNFRDYVLGKDDGVPKTPAWAEAITEVPASTIANLAKDYATIKPAALKDYLAPGRTAYGEQFHRAAITLAAMTGNIGIRGGNAPSLNDVVVPFIRLGPQVSSRMKGGSNPVDDMAPPRKESVFYQKMEKDLPPGANFFSGGSSSARVNRFHLADAILKGRRGGYPTDYKLLYLANTNYLNQYANTNKIAQALRKLEFIVVQEQVMNATAKFADILLPVNTFLERNDVTTGGIGPFYGYMNRAIDSLGESKSPFEIATELAARLGLTDYSDKTEEEWLREIVNECEDIPAYDEFKREGILKLKLSKPYVAFEDQINDPVNNPFPTPSHKIEIYSQLLADMNNPLIPPMPKYIEAWESHRDRLSQKYPLQLITTHTKNRAHSQFNNVPWLRELYPQVISLNTKDAEIRCIKDGDMVRVFNDRGEMIIPAAVTETIMPGVADIPQGAWYEPDENGLDRGGCANVLIKDEISPGGAFCSNSALIQVEKFGS